MTTDPVIRRIDHVGIAVPDLDAAIHTLLDASYDDQMLIQRMKKRKLALKDRIVQLGTRKNRVHEAGDAVMAG